MAETARCSPTTATPLRVWDNSWIARAPLYGEIADLTVVDDGRRVHSVAEQILRELAAGRATP